MLIMAIQYIVFKSITTALYMSTSPMITAMNGRNQKAFCPNGSQLIAEQTAFKSKWQQSGVSGITLDYNTDGTDVYIRWKVSSSVIYLVSFGITQKRIVLYRFNNNVPTTLWTIS